MSTSFFIDVLLFLVVLSPPCTPLIGYSLQILKRLLHFISWSKMWISRESSFFEKKSVKIYSVQQYSQSGDSGQTDHSKDNLLASSIAFHINTEITRELKLRKRQQRPFNAWILRKNVYPVSNSLFSLHQVKACCWLFPRAPLLSPTGFST